MVDVGGRRPARVRPVVLRGVLGHEVDHDFFRARPQPCVPGLGFPQVTIVAEFFRHGRVTLAQGQRKPLIQVIVRADGAATQKVGRLNSAVERAQRLL